VAPCNAYSQDLRERVFASADDGEPVSRITKTGNREIRKLLVLGATSMVYRADG
jgi:hypothetical protein